MPDFFLFLSYTTKSRRLAIRPVGANGNDMRAMRAWYFLTEMICPADMICRPMGDIIDKIYPQCWLCQHIISPIGRNIMRTAWAYHAATHIIDIHLSKMDVFFFGGRKIFFDCPQKSVARTRRLWYNHRARGEFPVSCIVISSARGNRKRNTALWSSG